MDAEVSPLNSTAAKSLPPGIHIILGHSAGGTFTRLFRARDRLLVDEDVLSCGPTPACADLDTWNARRRDYWMSLVPDASRHVPSPFNLVDMAHRLRDAERTFVWAATSLSEQLFIANVVRLVDLVGADPARISVIQFESYPDRAELVLGMGLLNEENMSRHPAPAAMSNESLADYRAAWRALTSDDPAAFESFPEERPNAYPWLGQAMQLMRRRFPDRQTGLPRWDHKLLAATRECGPRAARIIGHAMTVDWNEGDFVGDMYLFGRLLRLGDVRLPKPLLTLTGDRAEMRKLDVALTSFGEAVLDGRASNYPANPIEDWVGGTRLSSAEGRLWFNDAGRVMR